MKKPLQLQLYGNPMAVAAQPDQSRCANQVPFGHNVDAVQMGMAAYLGSTRPGIGQSLAPILHGGSEVADMNAWNAEMGHGRFSEYMATPAAQYHMLNLAQQQRQPMMEQSNTESQWKAFVVALNAAFKKAGG